MTVFAFSSLLAAVIAAFLGIYILYRNPRGALNWLFFLFCSAGACASFAEFQLRMAESATMAQFWLKASSLGVCFSIPLEVHFMLAFTERKKLLAKWWVYVLLYAPALMFALFLMTGVIALRPVKVYWGWTYDATIENVADALFGAWVAASIPFAIYLCLRYYIKTTERMKKRQALYLLIGLSLAAVSSFATEISSSHEIPELSAFGFVLESTLVWYAIRRYGLFSLTPATAADKIVATMADAVILIGPGRKIATVNRALLELLGYEEHELLGQPVEMIIAQEERSQFTGTHFEQILATGSISDTETAFETKDGARMPVSLSGSVMQDEHGVEQGVVCIGHDLTNRKQAEERLRAMLFEREALLMEVHHRVKNNLQIISSLLKFQSGYVTDERALRMFDQSQGMIRSIALVHEKLYRSLDLARIDSAEYIRDLVVQMFRLYHIPPTDVALEMDVDGVMLDLDTAIPCGLIINELVSNALKHAFSGGREGKVRVSLQSQGDQLALTVSDDGVGLPDDLDYRGARSMGLQLVNTLVEQLDATLGVDSTERGTVFCITFAQPQREVSSRYGN
ncbi:MAG: PAS domain S-box protein [Anaerolineae bacterium]|nr:PAS domain S-box protein [Anaerolineae bacterium]